MIQGKRRLVIAEKSTGEMPEVLVGAIRAALSGANQPRSDASARTGELLVNIYQADQNADVRHAVINALFLQGNAKALVELARKERDPEVKKDIITKLGLMHSKEAADYLMEYLKD